MRCEECGRLLSKESSVCVNCGFENKRALKDDSNVTSDETDEVNKSEEIIVEKTEEIVDISKAEFEDVEDLVNKFLKRSVVKAIVLVILVSVFSALYFSAALIFGTFAWSLLLSLVVGSSVFIPGVGFVIILIICFVLLVLIVSIPVHSVEDIFKLLKVKKFENCTDKLKRKVNFSIWMNVLSLAMFIAIILLVIFGR